MTESAIPPGTDAAPILEMIGVTKRFPGVVANDRVDLALRPGEVHVLLGENGAGKSTLIGILSGLLQPDDGEIRIDGRRAIIHSPRDAIRLGIGCVYQSVMLAPTLTVAENLALGMPWWRRPHRKAIAARLAELGRDFGIAVDPDAVTGELSLGEQQQIEIARALMRGGRVLILDEATSMLTPRGIEELGALMRRLTARGLAVVFITHKLAEAIAFGDRITVLRLGRKVGEIAPERLASLDEQSALSEIVTLMFGRGDAHDPDAERAVRRRAFTADHRAEPVLSVRGLSVAGEGPSAVHDVSFDLAEGEILGVAGIDGNGQKQLAEALAGQRPMLSGEVRLGGERIDHLGVGARRRRGLRYQTDDRHHEGTLAAFPVATNFLAKDIGAAPFWTGGLERPGAIDRHAARLVEGFDVRTPSTRTPIGRLSGGNMQKAILARELSGAARAVVYAKPTYGLDVQNIEATRRRIREAADAGVATLLISTDLDELLALADRIAVMSRGRLVGIVDNGPNAREKVGELMIARAAPGGDAPAASAAPAEASA